MDDVRILSANCVSGHEGYIAGAIITFYLESLNVHYLLNRTGRTGATDWKYCCC